MHPDLEAIVSADEEARSRVDLAETRRDRTLAEARAARDDGVERRRRASAESLEKQLQAIHAEGDARVAALAQQQTQYLVALEEGGRRVFEDAVKAWLRIVCEASR